jgi:hypothetical protein
MESDIRYYSRRATEEALAASRAVTEQARLRRLQLAESFKRKVQSLSLHA